VRGKNPCLTASFSRAPTPFLPEPHAACLASGCSPDTEAPSRRPVARIVCRLLLAISIAALLVITPAQTVLDFPHVAKRSHPNREAAPGVRGAVRWGSIPYSTCGQPYIVRIVLTAATMAIAFPGGSGNFLNVGAYPLNGPEVTAVRNHRDWWVKTVSRASPKNEAAVVLTARRLMDWWKAARPTERRVAGCGN
jgi:hypothetical protein